MYNLTINKMKKSVFLFGNGRLVKSSNSFKMLERDMFKRASENPWVYYEICDKDGKVLSFAN